MKSKKSKPRKVKASKHSTQKKHDHSRVLHGRSYQTDIYPDGSLVNPYPKLGIN